jgi:hypothetical protein
MSPAEVRMLRELHREPGRRVVDRRGARWLEITRMGASCSYSAGIQDPTHWRFSRLALASLVKKDFVRLAREIGGSVPMDLYQITDSGRVALREQEWP